ncbi:MAG: hypothetical protein WD063_13585 [Pirellulales bacterium]
MTRNFRDSGSLARARDNGLSAPGAGKGGDFNRGQFDGRGKGNFDGHGGKFDGHGGKFDGHGGKFDGHGGNFDGRNFAGHGWYGNNYYNHHGNSFPWWGFIPGFTWGWGWGGGWGGGWGWGSPWGYYGGWPYCGYGGWGGYGYYPYGYGNYGYPATTTYLYADNSYDNPPVIDRPPAGAEQAPAADQGLPAPTAEELDRASQYVSLGEQAFRAGRYQDALREWQHAMVDNPNNGAVLLLISQGLFALGQYDAAANSVQMAMQMLPENEWDGVVKNYSQIYLNVQDYTDQIRSAEKARDAKPDDGAIRFLLGYNFGYLNYPKQAVRELDKALDIEPKDAGAQKLRDMFAKQAGLPARPPAAAPEPAPKAQEGAAPNEPTPAVPATPPAKPEAKNDPGIPAAT